VTDLATLRPEAALEDIVDPCVSEDAHWSRMRGAREVLMKGATLP
jgi:hypothetical protein